MGRSAGSFGHRSARPGLFAPVLDNWPDAGVYQLRIRVSSELRIKVGRLGRFALPKGVYVYTGRASRGLRARVLRHVNGGKRKHWHIDYLLAHPEVRVKNIVLASRAPETECVVNQKLARYGQCVVSGFGASDCRNGCPAHLWLVP